MSLLASTIDTVLFTNRKDNGLIRPPVKILIVVIAVWFLLSMIAKRRRRYTLREDYMPDCVDDDYKVLALQQLACAHSNQLDAPLEAVIEDCACPLCVFEEKGCQIYNAENPGLTIRGPDERDCLPECCGEDGQGVVPVEIDPRGEVITCESLPMAYHRGRVVMSDRVPILYN